MRHMHIPIIMQALRFMRAPPFQIRISAGFNAIILVGFALVNRFPKDLHSTQKIVRFRAGGLRSQRMRLSVFFSRREPMVCNSCTMMTISATVTSITGVLYR